MKTRTMLAIGATTLGLTLVGATAASAIPTPDGTSVTEWARQMVHGGNADAPGYGYGYDGGAGTYGMMAGDGTGDPADCPYFDGTVADQDQVRQRLHDGTGAGGQQRLQDRVDRVDS